MNLTLTGGNKDELQGRIISRTKLVHAPQSTMIGLLNLLKKDGFYVQSPLHKSYRTNFNYVDIADRFWYQVALPRRITDWKAKMVFSVLKLYMINVWGYFCQQEYLRWIEFRKAVAYAIIQTYVI